MTKVHPFCWVPRGGRENADMSRQPGMTLRARRAWAIGLIVFFFILFGTIGFAQWWAYNKNVPAWQRVNASRS